MLAPAVLVGSASGVITFLGGRNRTEATRISSALDGQVVIFQTLIE